MSSKRASAIVPFSTNAVRLVPKKLVPVPGMMSPGIDICIYAIIVKYCITCNVRELCTYVEARDCGEGGPLRGPVRDDEALKAEFAFEDLIQGPVVLAGEGVVDEVWHGEMGSIYARH